MFAKITEEKVRGKVVTLVLGEKVARLISEKRNQLVPGEEWENICLLILYLVRESASPYFIYERLHKWAPSMFKESATDFVLGIILRGLENLCHRKLAEKKDLSAIKTCEEYQRYCSLHVTGLFRSPKKQRIPSAYKVSKEGRLRILELFEVISGEGKYDPRKRVASVRR